VNRRLAGFHAGLLFAVLGVVAWASGRPFVFPSLGPSAFLMAVDPRGEAVRPRRVLGGHAVGAVAGFLSYAAFAGNATLIGGPPALSAAGAGLVASGVVSVALTSSAMVYTGTEHAPACATTLIVSLGLLPSLADVGVIVASVAGLFLAHRATLAGADALGA
jgi:hypothetical protein